MPRSVSVRPGAIGRGDMRFDQLPRSDRIEDRRDEDSRGFARGGGLGLGAIILLGLIAWALGINPLYLIGGAEILSRMGGSTTQSQPTPQSPRTQTPTDQTSEFVSAVLGSTEAQWKEMLTRGGKAYRPASLSVWSGATYSACRLARSELGALYWPRDQSGYLKPSFCKDPERRFHACDAGSRSCQFSQAYVITHEIGHHVQNRLGILPQV